MHPTVNARNRLPLRSGSSKDNVAPTAAAPGKRKSEDETPAAKPPKVSRLESKEVPSRYNQSGSKQPPASASAKKPTPLARSTTAPANLKATPSSRPRGKAPAGAPSSRAPPSATGAVVSGGSDLEECLADNAELTATCEKLNAKINSLQSKNEKIAADLEEAKSATAAEAEARTKAEDELAAMRTKLEEAEKTVAAAVAIEEGLRADKAALEESLAAREADVATLAERGRAQEVLRRQSTRLPPPPITLIAPACTRHSPTTFMPRVPRLQCMSRSPSSRAISESSAACALRVRVRAPS